MARQIIQLKTMYFFLFLHIVGCISLQRGIQSKLYYSSSNLAVYKLEISPIEFSKIEIFDKVQVKEKLIRSILFTIRKEESILKLSGGTTLWNSVTVEELIPIVKEILSPTNIRKTFFLIAKEEDTLSPYSRIFRTTVYINRDGNTLQMVFGDVDNNIIYGAPFSFQDWANPSFFKLVCEKKKVFTFNGKLESAFQFKKDISCEDKNVLSSNGLDLKLEKLNNYKWIQIDLEKVITLDKEKDLGSEKINRKTREMRLNELKDLYKKGLINKEDYEIKKAEVLGEL